MRVYWLDKKSVTVERNIYYDRTSVSCPKGEIDGLIRMKANTPIVLSTPSAPTSSSQAAEPPAPLCTPTPPPAAKPAFKEPPAEKHI